MIKVLLKGGLGNQLFQYAYGLALATERNDELILDTSYFRVDPIRKYTLDMFNIQASSANFSAIARLLLRTSSNYFSDKDPYKYTPVKTDKKSIVLDGYFQNYLYFSKIEQTVRDNLQINKYKLEDNSVGIFIRRGDYLSIYNKSLYVYLDASYYNAAINSISKRVSNPKFYIFAYDDKDWVKDNLKLSEYTFIDTKDDFNEYFKLFLSCKHHIIANSTFSFWGAWLNNNDGIKIGPKSWIKKYTDFNYPSHWEVI